MARAKKTKKKTIPVARRSGPKRRTRSGKLVCKYGVAKTGKRRGNCLKHKRCKK